MAKRFISIWFRQLTADWFTLRYPSLAHIPFVVCAPSRGRILITAVNSLAQAQGVETGMAVADARTIIPALHTVEDLPDLPARLLTRLAEYCIRFTPSAAIDPPDGLILEVSGCAHLWGGDKKYLADITGRLIDRGYSLRAAIADTIGVAWGVARFGKEGMVVDSSALLSSLGALPPAALRLEADTIDRLHKLGIRQLHELMILPRPALRRRFGAQLMKRLYQAIGQEDEEICPVQPAELYQVRLPCPEPIVTATGIGIALKRLLDMLCIRLQQEQRGLRIACFKSYRADGKIIRLEIRTNRPSFHIPHLFKLFEDKLATIEPGMGIELFVLEAPKIEPHFPVQEKWWNGTGGLEDAGLSELLDRLTGRVGDGHIHRYLPAAHHLPEKSVRFASTLNEQPAFAWHTDKPRPLQLLSIPERIEVTAPIPDYPPMLFRYKGKLHTIVKADGPERIEQEWWVQDGRHRDYYGVEDHEGNRYWLFRSGHYTPDKTYQWFIHGFFA